MTFFCIFNMCFDWIHSGELHVVLENFIFNSHVFRSDEMHFSG